MALGKTADTINTFVAGNKPAAGPAGSGGLVPNPNIQIGQQRLQNQVNAGGHDAFAHDADGHADGAGHGAKR